MPNAYHLIRKSSSRKRQVSAITHEQIRNERKPNKFIKEGLSKGIYWREPVKVDLFSPRSERASYEKYLITRHTEERVMENPLQYVLSDKSSSKSSLQLFYFDKFSFDKFSFDEFSLVNLLGTCLFCVGVCN